MKGNATIGDTSIPFYHFKDKKKRDVKEAEKKTESKPIKQNGVEKQ